jgi:hypothetical protein
VSPSSQINVQALETLRVLMPRVRPVDLGAHAMPLITALAANLAAQNQAVRTLRYGNERAEAEMRWMDLNASRQYQANM